MSSTMRTLLKKTIETLNRQNACNTDLASTLARTLEQLAIQLSRLDQEKTDLQTENLQIREDKLIALSELDRARQKLAHIESRNFQLSHDLDTEKRKSNSFHKSSAALPKKIMPVDFKSKEN